MTSPGAAGPSARDAWTGGAAYERYMGRWSRPVADRFVRWLDAPHGADWLDVGCGTGALLEAVLARGVPRSVFGCDSAVPYLRHARLAVRDPRAGFEVGDAMRLPFPHAAFDVIVSGLALNFLPEPEAGLREMVRVARPGGRIGIYVWDYPGEMEILRVFWNSAVDLDPAALDLDEGLRFPLCSPHRLEDLFRGAGVIDVSVEPIESFARFRDIDDYWSPFLEGQGPAPSYVATLSGNRQAELRERIRERLPFRPDGSFTLSARAWAARGTALPA